MRISKRLKTICDLVTPGYFVADVGADHGLVEKYLVDNEISPYIIAIENKKGPFEILKNSLKEYSNVDLSLSDGIEDINEKIDCIIIAGMGGFNITNILNKDKNKLSNIKQIIIDPHRDQELAKQTIINLGFTLSNEIEVVDANKKYKIFSFIRSR